MKAITCYICGKKKIPKAQVPSKNELFLKLESTPRRKSNKICNRCYRDNLKMKKFIQENKDIKEENSCLKQELDYLKELVQQQKKEINHQFSIYKEVKKQLKTTLSWVNILNEKCDSIARTEMELRENLCEVQKEKENLKNQQITIHSHLMYQLTKENQDLKTQVEKNQIKIGNLRDSVYYWKITKPKRKEKKKEEEQMKRDSLKNLSQNQTSLDGENENNQNENNQNEKGKGKEKTKIESKSIKKFRKLYENDRKMRSAFNIGTKIVGISISKFYRFLNLFEIKTQDGLQDYCDEVKIKLAPIVNSMAESILDLSAEEVEQSTDPSSTQTMEHMKNHFISDKDIDKIANSSRKLFINKELTNSSSLLDLKEKIYQLVISNEKKNSIERKDQNKNNSNQQIENESQPEIDSTKKIDSIFSHDVAYSHRNNRAADACAIFIEANTKFNRIIHYQRMSSTSTIHPQSLEGFLIPKGIQKLSEKYNILATVHDQNTSSKVKQCFPNIMHLLDPWHVTRSIRRRYNKLVNKFCGSNKKKRSKEESEKMRKKKEHLMSWKESIIFHFLRCAKSCQGDMTTLLSEWFRYFLHAKGDHSLCPKNSPCTKNENSNENKHPEDKKITNKEEEAFFKMILSDFTIIKKLIFCRYFLSTSYNESFFSTLNGYREKISHFKNYNLLYQLAIIDWNQNREKENEKEINLGNQENEIEFNEKNALQENQKKEKDMEWQKELLHLSLPGIFQKSTSYLKNLTLSRIKKKKRNSSEEIVPPQKEKKRSRKSPKKEASLKTKKNLISTFLLSKIQPNLFDFENYSLLPTFQIHFKDALEMLNPKETHKQTQKETENSCPNIHDLHIFSNQNPSLLSRKSKIDNKNDVPIQTKTNNHNAIQNIQLPKPREIQLLEEDYIHNKREEIKRFLNDLIDNPINLYLPSGIQGSWWKRWDLEQMLESQDLSIGLVNFLYPQYQNDVEFTRLDFEPTIQKLHQEYKDFQAFKNRRNQIYEDFDKFLEASKKSYPKLIDHFNNFVENRPRMNKIDVFSNWLMSPELRNQIELFESLIEFEKGVDGWKQLRTILFNFEECERLMKWDEKEPLDIIPIIYLTNHHYVCFLIDKQFHKIYLYNTIPKYAKKEVEDMGNHIKQYIKWRINENYEIEELVKKKIQEDGAQCGNSVLLFLWLIFTIKIPIEKAVEIINHSLAVRFRFMILKCICKSTRIQLLFKSPEFIQDIIQNHPKKYRHNSFFLF